MDVESKWLSRWLIFAASLRVLSVFIGYMNPDVFKTKVFRRRPDLVNPLYGRTFATWTAVTCMLCVLCAFNMREPTLYLATMGSFAAALLHFGTELVIYKTVDVKGATSPFLVASISLVWMGLGWGTYTSY